MIVQLLRHYTLSDEDQRLARLFHQSKFQRHFGSGNRLRRSVGGGGGGGGVPEQRRRKRRVFEDVGCAFPGSGLHGPAESGAP